MKFLRCTIVLVVIIGCWEASYAQKARRPPSSEEIVRNMTRNFAGINDFTATMTGEVRMERMQVPRTVATMYFKKPDKIHFVSSGFSLVPREGMVLNPEALNDRFTIQVVGNDSANGLPAVKLELTAKDPKARTKRMFGWVDPVHWSMVRVETMPYEGRMVVLEFTYMSLGDTLRLPSSVRALFGATTPEAESAFKIPEGAPSPAGQLEEMQRSIRSGSLTFTYSDYRINTGLPDSLFTQPSDRR